MAPDIFIILEIKMSEKSVAVSGKFRDCAGKQFLAFFGLLLFSPTRKGMGKKLDGSHRMIPL